MSDQGPGLSVELVAKLTAGVDKLTDKADRWGPPMTPVFYRVGDDIVMPEGGIGWCQLGGPDQGHFWYVRSIVVGGLTPGTAAAGVADVYVSAADLTPAVPATAAAPSLLDWRDRATALPLISFYGQGELPLRLNERLFVRFSGATMAQRYVVGVQVEDYQEGALRQGWDR